MKNVAASLLLLSCTLQPLRAAALPASPPTPATAASHGTIAWEFHPRWSQLAQQDLRPALREAIAQAQRRYEGIAQLREEEMNFENTFGVLDSCSYDIASLTQIIFVLTIIADTPQVRANMTSMIQQHTQYSSEVKQNRPLWQALERAAAQPWVRHLSPERQLYIRDTLRDYKQRGGHLDESQHKQLQAITVRLTQLSEQFKSNIIASTQAWQHVTADRAQLRGLSDARLDTLAQQARARGYGSAEQPQWLLTFDLDCGYSILMYCEVEATRRLVWEALEGVAIQAPYDNRAVIRETLRLRQQYAELLGHSNYADYAVQNAMLETGAAALAFVDQSLEKLQSLSQSERSKLLAFITERRGIETHSINAWDASYYLRQYREQLQEKQVSSWGLFPAAHTLERIFSVFETLFAISIEPVDAEVWHPDIRAYGIYDQHTQEKKHLGTFYLDQYIREGKAAGAWTTPIHTGSRSSREPRHLSLVRSNFYKPEEGEKYYNISELITLFHELGHVMHLTLSDVELSSQAGLQVPMDFIEMPSQLMEKWVTDENILASLSKSVFTGEPITPQEAAALLQHYQTFDIWSDMTQLGQAKLDLEMHLHYKSQFAHQDIDTAAYRILRTAELPYKQRYLYFFHTWQHVFGNSYGAGYYGYEWTKLLAEDAFTRFRGEGLMNSETGRALRESILERGKSVPASQQYRDFMGRDPRL